MRSRRFVLLSLTLVTCAVAPGARADEPSASGPTEPPPKTEPEWPYPEFRPIEYVATGVAGAAAFAVFFVMKPREEPRWTGGILFDDAFRDTFRLRAQSGRDAARAASDITGVATILLATGVDSLILPLARGRTKTAFQLLLMDAESFALNTLVTTSMYNWSGRARPTYEDCLRDPSYDSFCNVGSTTSFWSGHTAEAFTAAGLSCAHHAYAHVYGSAAADIAGCAGSLALASTTGTLRLLGDRHYASDVFLGAIFGFGMGYGLPTLLHYTWKSPSANAVSAMVTPMHGGAGFQVGGKF